MGLFGKCIKAFLKRLSSYKYTVWGLGLRHMRSTLTSVFRGIFKTKREDMRKRQVVLRREEASRSSTTSSFTVRNVRYGECQKNHAAGVGGFAVDGCREFMASGDEGSSGELTCAACGCHRNFHRRELETEVVSDCSSPSSNGS